MPVLKVTVTVDLDDVPVAGFPLVRRFTTNASQPIASLRATSASFTALPSGEMTNVQALVLQADQTVSLAFNGQTTNFFKLNPNGFIVAVDLNNVTALTLQNNSGSSSNIRGILAGN